MAMTVRTSRGGAILWVVLLASFLLLISLLFLLNARLRSTVDALEAENVQLATEGLPRLLSETDREAAAPRTAGLAPHQIRLLMRQGLSHPVEDLIADLMNHPELIPAEGALGGTMGFYSEKNIRILTDRYAFASFDDGHSAGYMLLRYHVHDGEIGWTVIDSYVE